MPSLRTHRTHHWFWPAMLLMGSAVAVLAWIVLALATGRQVGWMAVITALEVSWMLQLGTLRRGPLRLAVTLASVLLVAAVANWGIVAGHIGAMMGLELMESGRRLGPHLAWTYAGLLNSWLDLAWLAAPLLLGTWLATGKRR